MHQHCENLFLHQIETANVFPWMLLSILSNSDKVNQIPNVKEQVFEVGHRFSLISMPNLHLLCFNKASFFKLSHRIFLNAKGHKAVKGFNFLW